VSDFQEVTSSHPYVRIDSLHIDSFRVITSDNAR